MTVTETYNIWLIIAALGAGSFALRFSFLGMIGKRKLPEWALRHLRYTAVAVLPGLVAPLALFPAATQGQTDPARLCAALVTLVAGYLSKSVLIAILAGASTLYGVLWVLG